MNCQFHKWVPNRKSHDQCTGTRCAARIFTRFSRGKRGVAGGEGGRRAPYHGFIWVLHEDEGSPAHGCLGVVQVPPNEDARGQQETNGQQQHQDDSYCNLSRVAGEQVCNTPDMPKSASSFLVYFCCTSCTLLCYVGSYP